ncbi:cytochrome C biogenesis protein CcdA [Metapseudomonas resinovorans]|uniref:cytochrome c biogenesis CcdA family protein n=1 Tax=Metapseudomonas resinovorans TaxID=53412 RepID=UPI0009877D43|nr:cytochrome c biogenesis protein CcdA [Pseudomonas resinovorans]GLZ88012.1 cytochrome C biogenesis protein CcdA [Pseudomonas resinovorans]
MSLGEISILSALVAGMISFLSPCVLPLVPGYMSFMAGRTVDELQELKGSRERFTIIGMSLSFVLGFSTVFIALGASATAISRLLIAYRQETNLVGGLIVIALGLFMTGLINPRWLNMDTRFIHQLKTSGGPITAYLLGIAFAFGWTPCIGPILGSILTLSASTGASGANGVALLSIYSVGLGMPFLLTALFTNHFLAGMRRFRRWSRAIHIGAGVILILMGLAMVTGQLTRFAWWLLEAFPILGRIG